MYNTNILDVSTWWRYKTRQMKNFHQNPLSRTAPTPSRDYTISHSRAPSLRGRSQLIQTNAIKKHRPSKIYKNNIVSTKYPHDLDKLAIGGPWGRVETRRGWRHTSSLLQRSRRHMTPSTAAPHRDHYSASNYNSRWILNRDIAIDERLQKALF